MHDTARTIGGLFFKNYTKPTCKVVELGAMDVNGSLRDVCPKSATYIGMDVAAGRGVDIVIKPDAPLPIASNSVDIVISSSVFEHDMYFWETFLEVVRITKPDGVIYINAPSNGMYHRYPVDNWRFYPDSGKALESWARRNGYPLTLLESFIAERKKAVWNDFVAIFVKGTPPNESKDRFLSNQISCANVWHFDQPNVLLQCESSEDMILIERLLGQVEALQQDHLTAEAAPFASLARLFRWWTARRRGRKGSINLIPHIRVAFPNIAARLANPSQKLDGLSVEIRRLLDAYIVCWPFDEHHYIKTYPDIAEGVRTDRFGSGWEHFRQSGYLEGRFPIKPGVDTDWYLETYRDVAAAVEKDSSKSAEQHFVSHGYREGRLPFKPQVDVNWYSWMYLPEAKNNPPLCEVDFVPRGYRSGKIPAPAEVAGKP
jgi:SAM-dependent methyltransferase